MGQVMGVVGSSVQGAPGQTTAFRVSLQNAVDVTVGLVGISISGPSGVTLPTATDILAVTTANGGLMPVSPGPDPATNIAKNLNSATLPTGVQAIGGFLLHPENGFSGTGPIMDFIVQIPAGTAAGTVYNVALVLLSFSNSTSQAIEISATGGTITVMEGTGAISLAMGSVMTNPVMPAGLSGIVLPPSGQPTGVPSRFSGYAVIAYTLTGSANGVSWSIVRAAGEEALDLGTIQDVSDASGTRAIYTAPPVTPNRNQARIVQLKCASNEDSSVFFTLDVKVLPYGDADMNGTLTSFDAVKVFRWSLGIDGARRVFDAPSDLQMILCDVQAGSQVPVADQVYDTHRAFSNGQILSNDAVRVFRMQLGLAQVP
jgi:hypothetical protein